MKKLMVFLVLGLVMVFPQAGIAYIANPLTPTPISHSGIAFNYAENGNPNDSDVQVLEYRFDLISQHGNTDFIDVDFGLSGFLAGAASSGEISWGESNTIISIYISDDVIGGSPDPADARQVFHQNLVVRSDDFSNRRGSDSLQLEKLTLNLEPDRTYLLQIHAIAHTEVNVNTYPPDLPPDIPTPKQYAVAISIVQFTFDGVVGLPIEPPQLPEPASTPIIGTVLMWIAVSRIRQTQKKE